MTTDVGFLGAAASLALVAVGIALSVWQRLGLGWWTVESVVRAAAQLAVVGFALDLVLAPDRPLVYAWLWVAAIVVFAAATITRRAPRLPRVFPLAFVACACTLAVVLLVVYGFDIFPLEARTLVPVAGMTIGNAMKAGVVGAQRLVDEFTEKRRELEARLALGLRPAECAQPVVRSVLRTAITPQIETTKAIGLVFLPGALTGLVLAGADAGDAVLVQLALVYLILGSVVTIATIVVLGGVRALFTADDRLVDLVPSG